MLQLLRAKIYQNPLEFRWLCMHIVSQDVTM